MDKVFLAKKYSDIDNPLGDIFESDHIYDDMLNLTVGDPDLTTHISIIENAFEDAKRGYTHYTDPQGYEDFLEGIIKYYKEEYNMIIEKDEVMASVGACHGIFLTLQCILDDEDEVIIPDPFFPVYKNQVNLARGKVVLLETSEEEGFNINISKLKKAINSKTKAIILNTPNNPTGVCYSDENIGEICEIAKKNNILIISDEVYDAFSFEKPFKPVALIGNLKENIVTVGSLSKDFAMTGWRVGFVIAPNYIINCMKNLNESICFSASSISQRAAIYALENRKKIQPDIVKEYKQRVQYSYERIKNIKNIHAIKPQGAIYLFVNIKNTGLSSNEFTKKLLVEKHIAVIPGTVFGHGGEGYVRVACTICIEKLKIAFDRIEQFCNEII